jgi:hypothetical protein
MFDLCPVLINTILMYGAVFFIFHSHLMFKMFFRLIYTSFLCLRFSYFKVICSKNTGSLISNMS